MKHSTLRLGGYGLFVLAAVAACSTDERSLSYEFRAVESAGAPASAGRANAGDTSTAGDSGEPSAPQAGATSSAGGARGSNAGAASSSAGAAGEAGASMEDAGAAGAAASSRGGSSASGGAAGSPAAGGGVVAGGSSTACGDLNEDSIDDCQQTLVQNAQFNSAVTGWDSEPSTTAVWDPTDGTGKPGSGSIRVSNSAAMVQAPGVTVIGSRQCIPVTPTGTYDFAARVLLPSGQGAGKGAINVWFYDDNQCQGNLVTGATPISGGTVGEWQTLSSNLWIPGGVHSMFVRLVAIKPFVTPSLSVLIDDVLIVKR